MSCDEGATGEPTATSDVHGDHDEGDAQNMDMDDDECAPVKDLKGKGKAVEPEQVSKEAEKDRRREERRQAKREARRQNARALRPILTIQKSEGFVWNQVCRSWICSRRSGLTPSRISSCHLTSKTAVRTTLVLCELHLLTSYGGLFYRCNLHLPTGISRLCLLLGVVHELVHDRI
jgi:hypothetical protein